MPSVLRVVVLALLTVGCRCTTSDEVEPIRDVASIDLVAAVEEEDGVRVLHRREGAGWSIYRRLPIEARALRFSRDGRHVAWIVDELRGNAPVMVGHLWRADETTPIELGVLGFGVHHHAGWDVGDDGRVAYVDERGKLVVRSPDGRVRALGVGSDPVFGRGEMLAFREPKQPCLVVPEGLPCVSGALVRPFAFAGTTLWAQSGQRVAIVGPGREAFVDVPEPLAVRPHDDGRALVLHRRQSGGHTSDELSLFQHGGLTPLLEAPIIHAVDWAPDGRAVVVRSASRDSLYELLLAHTPETAGGERGTGEALLIDPETRAIEPIAGLESRRVRTISRVVE